MKRITALIRFIADFPFTDFMVLKEACTYFDRCFFYPPFYLAKATDLVSRITVTLIWPG